MTTYHERLALLEKHMGRAYAIGRVGPYQRAFAGLAVTLKSAVAEFARRCEELQRTLAPIAEAGRRIEAMSKAERRLVALGYHQVRAAGAVRDALARSKAIPHMTLYQALDGLVLAAEQGVFHDHLPYLSPDGKSTTPPERSWLLTEDDPLS